MDSTSARDKSEVRHADSSAARECNSLRILSIEPAEVLVGSKAVIKIRGSAFLNDDLVQYVSNGARWLVKSESLIELSLADEDTSQPRMISLNVHGIQDGCLSNTVQLKVE